jgi:hypothetical protein
MSSDDKTKYLRNFYTADPVDPTHQGLGSTHIRITKDSGARDEFDSGMVRDTQKGKARFDLMLPLDVPYDQQMITRFAELLARGAEKYGDRNWEKGDSDKEIARARSSALRHMMQWACGETDEDHAAAVMFNIMMVETLSSRVDAGKQPGDLIFVSPPNCNLCGGPTTHYSSSRDGVDGVVTMTYECYNGAHDVNRQTITIPVEPVKTSIPSQHLCTVCDNELFQSATDKRRWLCPVDSAHGFLLVVPGGGQVWMPPPLDEVKLDVDSDVLECPRCKCVLVRDAELVARCPRGHGHLAASSGDKTGETWHPTNRNVQPYPYPTMRNKDDKPSSAAKLQSYLKGPVDNG